jgi:hypothetical protein
MEKRAHSTCRTLSFLRLIGRDDFHETVIKTVQSNSHGATLFSQHCAGCLGTVGSGKIGPNIQGVPISLILNAISVVALMRGHSILSQGDLQEIADFLATIGGNTEPVRIVMDTEPCMQCHGSNLEGGISKIGCFSCHNGPDGSIGHPAGRLLSKDNPVNFHGRYGKDFVTACTNCHGFNLGGGIGPGCSSCHNGSVAPFL